MRPLFFPLALTFAASFAGCDATNSSTVVPADGEILLSTTGGVEEGLASRSTPGDLAPSGDPDQPPPMRECDASGTYTGIFSGYDVNANSRLDDAECQSVEDAHAGRDDMAERDAQMRWHMMLLVYDLDEDGALSDTEKVPLFDDFTTRCQTLSAKLLADFDADGDGTLSDAELATAEAIIEADHEAQRAEMEANMADHPDQMGPPPEPGSRQVPPGMESFDTDGSGLLSDAELSALRDALREAIRAGDPLVPPPPEG